MLTNTIGNRNIAIGYGAMDDTDDTFTDATCDYNDDPTITHDDDSGDIKAGMSVTGTGIPANAYVDTVTSVTEFELSVSTTGGSVTDGTLTFSGSLAADDNIFMGYLAGGGTWVAEGVTENNVAIGNYAMDSNLDGANKNTCVGNLALSTVTTADGNTAVGYQAGYSLSTGGTNTAVGAYALDGNAGSTGNTAIGYQTITGDAGSSNTAVGYQAGTAISGASNTCVGSQAGNAIVAGDSNTCIGVGSDASAAADNQIAIGNGAITDGANKGRWGNASVATNNIQADWTVDSDIRIKKDIESSDVGLSFINALKTRKYKKKHPSEYDAEILEARYKQGGANYDDKKDEVIKDEFDDDKVWNGLIAQEIKTVMDDLDVEFSGWSEDSKGKQGVQYSTLVVPLIKAVQELSAQVEELKNK